MPSSSKKRHARYRIQKRQQQGSPQYEKLEARQVLASVLPAFAADEGVLYQVHGVSDQQGQLSEIDLINETFSDVGDKAGFKINGTGFRTADGYIYGIKMDNDQLIRIGANGENEILGSVQGLPDGSYYTGDFGADGLLYLRHRNNYYGVNVDSVAVERVATADQDVTRTYDITFNPITDLHYSIRKNNQKAEFISIDLGSDSDVATISVINDNLQPAGTYGALFSDASGRVFAANNAGGLYEINVETGVATFAGQSPRASSNDGAASSQAFFDLPPVVTDAWMSTMAGEPATTLPIESPYDLEGQTLQVQVLQLPEVGLITDGEGVAVASNQFLTVEELVDLKYEPPAELAPDIDSVVFVYQVSDGSHTGTGQVEISFAGLSRITGQVVVHDDTEESSFAGYAFNNEIRIAGQDYLGNLVDQIVLTDVNGNYEFVDVAPGTYSIEQLQPPVVFDGYAEAGDAGSVVNKNRIETIVVGLKPTLVSGPTFFEYAPALISGFSYIDSNGNGVVDAAESGIQNVVLELSGVDFQGNSVDQSTSTDSYGFYEFRGLAPGSYRVAQIQPEDYIDAQSNVGETGGQSLENRVDGIVLNAGQVGNGYNFGEYESSSITGSVFIDNDIDKAFDAGDTPLENVSIRLTGVDFKGNQVKLETTTDDLGDYQFEGLLAGTYDLTQVQPLELDDGFSHIGIFNNDETTLATSGVAGANRINDIQVGVGRDGRSFNFSERLNYRFATTFDQTLIFEGTESADHFLFIAGEDFHTVILNGELFSIDASVRSNVIFDGKQGVDQVSLTGSAKVEEVTTTGDTATMRGETWRVHTFAAERIAADSGGGYDRAFMYDTVEDDRIKMTQDYSRMWSESYYVKTSGYHRSYAYAENGGEDRAYLYDSKYDDTVKMTSTSARMIGRKFYSFAGDFERVYAYSLNGGTDRAQFWDSDQDRDVFQAYPDYSRMYNDSFYNIATGFEQIDAFGINGGVNDRAYLFGSAGDELLVGSPRNTGMTGDGFAFDVHAFERTYAISNGGNDRALLFDSKLDDRFVAYPEDARLYNDEYYLNVKGFADVDAFSSSGGNDRAYFYDSAGDDTLIALENEMRLFGEGFDNTSHGFARNYAHSIAGGNDRALLYGTDQADTVKLDANVSKMYGESYYTWLNGFESVSTEFTNADRHDRALAFGAIDADVLAMSGELADLIYDHGAEFIYDDMAHADDDDASDDDDFASIFDDLAALYLDPDLSVIG